jgi:hypothetical protein
MKKEGTVDKSCLSAGEEILGSWSVFLGEPRPNSEKLAGKLHVTNQNIYFESGISIEENAGLLISKRLKAFEKVEKLVSIPYTEIGAATSVKKSLFQKALAVKLKSGEEIEFQFGAASPQKALDAILPRL